MVYAINWQPPALRQLRKLPVSDGREIRDRVTQELVDPFVSQGVKRLVGYAYPYRLRVGRYRVFFDVEEAVHIVQIEEVKIRNERTY